MGGELDKMVMSPFPNFALWFPGQGAQYVGMGRDLYEKCAAAKRVFDRSEDVLGMPLKRLCFEGPEDELNLTLNSQPAIFVTSLATWSVIREEYPGLAPQLTCGLSLGEFSALTAGGSLDFETGLRLVQKRGQWMHEAGSANPGGMCSVIGLSPEKCTETAAEAGIQVANYNSPEQTVLSGMQPGVEKALVIAKEKGAKKVIPLKVSGAFHSRLMSSAEEKLRDELAGIELKSPNTGFVPNVTAEIEKDPEKIRHYLALQVTHSVKWLQSMQLTATQGIGFVLEMGPGKVLKGLAKRTTDQINVMSVETAEDIKNIHSFFSQTV